MMMVWQNCKFGNFREGFSFVKITSSENGEITLSFTDIEKSCPSWEYLASQIICLFTLFAKIKFHENFRIYSNQANVIKAFNSKQGSCRQVGVKLKDFSRTSKRLLLSRTKSI